MDFDLIIKNIILILFSWIVGVKLAKSSNKPTNLKEQEQIMNTDLIQPVVNELVTSEVEVVSKVEESIPQLYTLSILKQPLQKGQYVDEVTSKNQIVIHHTAGYGADSTINYWNSNKERVATNYIIDRNGKIIECVPPDKWAYHLYVNSPGNKIPNTYKKLGETYDKHSIGIELCNLGPLKVMGGRFLDIYNKRVPNEKVYKLSIPFKGFVYYERYSPQQLLALENLIIMLCNKYDIPVLDEYKNFFDINLNALTKIPGIYTHVNYRTDKSDAFPYQPLVDMLNGLHLKINKA